MGRRSLRVQLGAEWLPIENTTSHGQNLEWDKAKLDLSLVHYWTGADKTGQLVYRGGGSSRTRTTDLRLFNAYLKEKGKTQEEKT